MVASSSNGAFHDESTLDAHRPARAPLPQRLAAPAARRQPLEHAPGNDTRKFRAPERGRRAALLRVPGHAGHAAAVRQDRLGLHAGRLEKTRRALDAALGLHAGDTARARAPGRGHARDAPGRRARAAPDGRAGPRRGGGGSHGDPREPGPPRPSPGSDLHRPRQPHQGERQHGRIAGLERDRRGGREAALGRAVGRRHRDGSLDRRRPRPHARGDRARRHAPDRHRADLLDDHRAQARRSRRGGHPRRPRAPGAPGSRLLHGPRRRAARAPAARARPADRNREPRRLAARQVDDRARPAESDDRAVGRDLRDPAPLRRDLLDRRRAAAGRARRRHRRGAARGARGRWAGSRSGPGRTVAR